LVEYALRLAEIEPAEVRFVIMDGSTAEGSDRKYSDYDVAVVRKGLSEHPGSVKDLFGVYRGRIVSGWLVDAESFKHRYIGDDDEDFLWRRRQLWKAKLLYGDRGEFSRIIKKALARKWNRKRQVAVIRPSYVTMLEYMGKMLNKTRTNQVGSPEFYQDGYVIAKNAALIVAAINRIDLDSDKSMYQQILRLARIKPPNFERDFEIASGLTKTPRKDEAVVSASRNLVRWARGQIVRRRLSEAGDQGFVTLTKELEF
jgi:predicted nucleotidyltransferase/Arc/MetJ family transcription regulator